MMAAAAIAASLLTVAVILIGRAACNKRYRALDDQSSANTRISSVNNTVFSPLIDNDVDIELSEGVSSQLQSTRDTSLVTALSDMPLGQSLVQAWRASDMQVTSTNILTFNTKLTQT